MVSSKLPKAEQSILTTMTELAKDHNAVNLALPMADFPCPEELVTLVNKYMVEGYNNFSSLDGVLGLREVIVARSKEMYGIEYDVDSEVTITAGVSQAVSTAISAHIREGDEVLVFEPASEHYVPAIELNGGRAVFVPLKSPDFRIEWDEVKKMISPKTKMIIVDSPHNITGAIFSDEDINQLRRLTNGTNIIILSSELFEHIVFGEDKHHSMAMYPDLAARSLIVSSFGPLYHISGWSLAYIQGPTKLMKEFRKIHQFFIYTVNTPMQYALADYLKKDKSYLEASDIYQGKKNYFQRLMEGSKYKLLPTCGSYYQVIDYSEVSDEPDTVFTERLVKEFGVATIPVSSFQHEKNSGRMIRICFAKPNDILEKGAQRLQAVSDSSVESE